MYDLYFGLRSAEFEPLPEVQREHLIRMQYAAQTAAYQAQYPGSDYQIVLRGDVPVGKIWLAALPDELHLVDILIAEPYRNAGIGSFLVRQLQQQAEIDKIALRSSIFRFNAGSLRFHRFLGFEVVGENEIQFHMEWLPSCLRA